MFSVKYEFLHNLRQSWHSRPPASRAKISAARYEDNSYFTEAMKDYLYLSTKNFYVTE